MGVCCLVYVFRAEIIDLGWVYVMAVSLIGGTACVVRSLSRERARSDRLKELDERNRANLHLISWGGLAAALILAFLGREENGPGPWTYVRVGLFFASAFGFIAQSLAWLYLDRHS